MKLPALLAMQTIKLPALPTPPPPLSPIKSSDTYVYGIGILAVPSIRVCVFFVYKTPQAENKKFLNEKQDQPPK